MHRFEDTLLDELTDTARVLEWKPVSDVRRRANRTRRLRRRLLMSAMAFAVGSPAVAPQIVAAEPVARGVCMNLSGGSRPASCSALRQVAAVATATPGWLRARAVCPRVSLTTGGNYSGVSGPFFGGLNMYSLTIIARRGVGCTTARRWARASWTTGQAGGLRWRQVASWRSTSGGSAAAVDILAVGPGVRVEYRATH